MFNYWSHSEIRELNPCLILHFHTQLIEPAKIRAPLSAYKLPTALVHQGYQSGLQSSTSLRGHMLTCNGKCTGVIRGRTQKVAQDPLQPESVPSANTCWAICKSSPQLSFQPNRCQRGLVKMPSSLLEFFYMHISTKVASEGRPGCSGQALLQLQSPLPAHAGTRAAGRAGAAVLFMRKAIPLN